MRYRVRSCHVVLQVCHVFASLSCLIFSSDHLVQKSDIVLLAASENVQLAVSLGSSRKYGDASPLVQRNSTTHNFDDHSPVIYGLKEAGVCGL